LKYDSDLEHNKEYHKGEREREIGEEQVKKGREH
jgi:hypothetical protein